MKLNLLRKILLVVVGLVVTQDVYSGGGSGTGAPFELIALSCNNDRNQGSGVRRESLKLSLSQGAIPTIQYLDFYDDFDNSAFQVFESFSSQNLSTKVGEHIISIQSLGGEASTQLNLSDLFKDRVRSSVKVYGRNILFDCVADLNHLKTIVQLTTQK